MSKRYLFLIMLLFLVVGCKGKEVEKLPSTEVKTKSIIYYFHSNVRCASCFKIEKYTKEVFEKNFKEKLELKSVDVYKSENKHFIADYGLYAKSVIVTKVVDGKEVGYKNLDKIWNYLSDEKQFKTYLKSEIDVFLLAEGE